MNQRQESFLAAPSIAPGPPHPGRGAISTGVARLGFFLGQEAGLAGGLGFLDIVRHGEVIGHQLLV